MLRKYKIKQRLLPLHFRVNVIVFIIILLGALFSTGIWYKMCDEINSQHYRHYTNKANIGANIMSDIFEVIFHGQEPSVFLTNKYLQIPPEKLKEFYSDPTKEIPLEYFKTVKGKYDVEYFIGTHFYRMAQSIVDKFSQANTHFSLVVLMDHNGQVPVNSIEYSQKLTGDAEHDLAYSRHKRIFPQITELLKDNKQGEFDTFLTDSNQLLHLFGSEISYKDETWGYFIIANKVEDMKDYQKKTQRMFMSIIIIMSIIVGVIAQRVLGV